MQLRNRSFLTQELPSLFATLDGKKEPNFGLMTAQHMVEHLIWSTKMFSRRAERAADWEPTRSVLGFQRFVAKGCPFEHRPKEGISKADLSPLRMNNIEDAIKTLMDTIDEMYARGDENPAYKSFHPSSGEFDMYQLDLLIGQHCRWHAYQFGLIETFTPAAVR